MTTCPWCHCDRLMHDSWGCKKKDGCAVSIVHITPIWPSQKKSDPARNQEIIDQGKALDAEEDRVSESHVRMIADRVLINQTDN